VKQVFGKEMAIDLERTNRLHNAGYRVSWKVLLAANCNSLFNVRSDSESLLIGYSTGSHAQEPDNFSYGRATSRPKWHRTIT